MKPTAHALRLAWSSMARIRPPIAEDGRAPRRPGNDKDDEALSCLHGVLNAAPMDVSNRAYSMWLMTALPMVCTVTFTVRVVKVGPSVGEASAQGSRSFPRCDERLENAHHPHPFGHAKAFRLPPRHPRTSIDTDVIGCASSNLHGSQRESKGNHSRVRGSPVLSVALPPVRSRRATRGCGCSNRIPARSLLP